MNPAAYMAVRLELERSRRDIDGALGTALLLLDRLERLWREDQAELERSRSSRLTVAELEALAEASDAVR